MSSVNRSTLKSKAGRWAFLVLRVLLVLLFASTVYYKLSGNPQAVAEFSEIGLGQWFRYFTAAVEIVGALLLLRRSTILFGAILLGAVSVGALLAQVLVLHHDVIHTIVLSVIFAVIAWTHRRQLLALSRARVEAN